MDLQIGNVTLPLDGVDVDISGGAIVLTERVNGYRLTITNIDRVFIWQESYSDEGLWKPYANSYTYDPETLVRVVQGWYTGVLWLTLVTS